MTEELNIKLSKKWETEEGLEAAIIKHEGTQFSREYYCGYIVIPSQYARLFRLPTVFDTFEIHYGITFANYKEGYFLDGKFVIGFDTGHFSDEERRWSVPSVTAECEKLSKQVKDLLDDKDRMLDLALHHIDLLNEYFKKEKGEEND